jgi:hypothetical protein
LPSTLVGELRFGAAIIFSPFLNLSPMIN